jgi:hypothetical protein
MAAWCSACPPCLCRTNRWLTPPLATIRPHTLTHLTQHHHQVTVDRSTIERHLLSGSTDPFSRAELSLDMVKPDIELTGKLAAWLAARQQKAGGDAQEDPMQVD